MGVVDSHDDIETLLQIIDPNNNQQMTYSEIVQLLSSVRICKIKPVIVNGTNQ